MAALLTVEETAQRKRLLSFLLRVAFPAAVVLGLINVYLGAWPPALALFGLAIVAGLAEWVNAKGHYIIASTLLVLTVLLVAHFNLYDGRGLQDPGILAYPLLVSLGTLLHGKRAALLWFIAGAVSLALIGYRDATLGFPDDELPDFDDFLVVLILMAVSTVLIWIIIERMTERTAALRESEERLQRANQTLEQRVTERTAEARVRAEQLRMLAEQLTQAEQKERERIADILHEHFQQLLVGARFSLNMVHVHDEISEEALRRTDGVLGEALETSRSLALELSPPVLRYYGLGPALNWLGQWMLERHGLKVEVLVDPDGPMPTELQALLFQAARELLFNVVKHAKVDQAKVELKQEAGGLLRLRVSDRGAGFDPTSPAPEARTGGGFGLFSIRERLSFLEGYVEIQSAPGAGTCISLTVPLSAKSDAPHLIEAKSGELA